MNATVREKLRKRIRHHAVQLYKLTTKVEQNKQDIG